MTHEIESYDFLLVFDVEFDMRLRDRTDWRDDGYVEDFVFRLTAVYGDESDPDFTPVEVGEREFCWMFGDKEFEAVEDAAWDLKADAERAAREGYCEYD